MDTTFDVEVVPATEEELAQETDYSGIVIFVCLAIIIISIVLIVVIKKRR